MIPTDNFILEEMTYFPTGMYHPVMSRPYMVNVTEQAINTIAERMDETKSGKVTPTILAGVASQIVVPSTVGYATGVNSDWTSTQRFIFMLKVKSFDMTGVEINSYIQGYTEHDGINRNTGNIDDTMVHYINNVIETTTLSIQTPFGVQRSEKLYRIYNVFASRGQEELFTQRPADVLDNINMMTMANVMSGAEQMNSFSTANFINPFNMNTVGSSVDNNITTEYLSKVLTTGVLVNKSQDIHLNSYEISEQSTIESKVPEPAISDNRFLKVLSMMTGSKTTRETFNFRQLMGIDNTIFNRFKLFELTKDIVDPAMEATPDVGDFWHGQDPVTPKAYALLENAAAMSVKYGFNKMYFTASNMSNPTGVPEIFVTNFKSFINLDNNDFQYLVEIFRQKFMQEVYLNESQSGRVPLHMEVYIDLLGTSKIYLAYAGYQGNWYTIPTFANSLFSQVATIDKAAFDYTSDQLNQVITRLSNEHNASRAYY